MCRGDEVVFVAWLQPRRRKKCGAVERLACRRQWKLYRKLSSNAPILCTFFCWKLQIYDDRLSEAPAMHSIGYYYAVVLVPTSWRSWMWPVGGPAAPRSVRSPSWPERASAATSQASKVPVTRASYASYHSITLHIAVRLVALSILLLVHTYLSPQPVSPRIDLPSQHGDHPGSPVEAHTGGAGTHCVMSLHASSLTSI